MTEHAKLLAHLRLGDTEAADEIAAGLALAGYTCYPVTVEGGDFRAIIREMLLDVESGEWLEQPHIHNRWGLADGG